MCHNYRQTYQFLQAFFFPLPGPQAPANHKPVSVLVSRSQPSHYVVEGLATRETMPV